MVGRLRCAKAVGRRAGHAPDPAGPGERACAARASRRGWACGRKGGLVVVDRTAWCWRAQGGLVVVDARYGVLDAILAAEAADAAAALRTAARDGVPAAAPADADDAGGAGHAGARDDGGGGEDAARGAREGRQGAAHEGEEEEEEGDEEDAADAAAVAAAAAARAAGRAPPPPPWVDVTAATRFLVARGRIVLHQARGARRPPCCPKAGRAAELRGQGRRAAGRRAPRSAGARMPPRLLMPPGLLSSRAPCPDPVSGF
jgi:hypothetical protein